MNAPAVLIATAKVRPGCEDAFAAWKGRHDATVATFLGFNSSDTLPPGERDDTWTILLNFDSKENLTAWQRSSERAGILAELTPLVVGGDLGEVMQAESVDSVQSGTVITQVIFSRIKPGMERRFQEWSARMQQMQSRYPGYRGMFFQPPAPGGTHWITMLRFADSDRLNAWIAAPERAAMLAEAREFIEGEELVRIATSFPGWVPIDPETGQAPPNWKTAILVLLGLYPIVALESLYVNPLLVGLIPAFAIFAGNALSVAITSFLTMPFLVRSFDWWLFADAKQHARTTAKGIAVIAVFFVCEIVFFSFLFHWKNG